MAKKTIFLFPAILLILASAANSAMMSQNFYVEVVRITLEPLWPSKTIYDEDAATAQCPVAPVGSKIYGTIIYDGTDIPKNGRYIIGGQGWGSWSGPDEFQDWQLEFGGMTPYGFMIAPATVLPELRFVDGRLEGIFAEYNAGLGAGSGLESEIFSGTGVTSFGGFHYSALTEDGMSDITDAWFTAEGRLCTLPVPEPYSSSLFALAILAFAILQGRYHIV